METGAEGSLGHGFSSSSKAISRGQWERRLQTDIHMAKKALSEALSPTNKIISSSSLEPNNNLCNDHGSIKPIIPTISSSYASSADNIARLLKGWMKNPPKASSRSATSIVTQNSFNNLAARTDTASSEGTPSGAKGNSAELSETFESLFGYDSLDLDSSNSDFSPSLSPEANFFQEERKPYTNSAEMPFSLLEKWLLDDAGCQEKISCHVITSSADHATMF